MLASDCRIIHPSGVLRTAAAMPQATSADAGAIKNELEPETNDARLYEQAVLPAASQGKSSIKNVIRHMSGRRGAAREVQLDSLSLVLDWSRFFSVS